MIAPDGRGGKSLNTLPADPKLTIFDGPVVVIIDRGTAGAAEVVASAFIERKPNPLLIPAILLGKHIL